MSQFDLNTIIQRNESNFLTSSLGEEVVMMDLNSGDYLGINSVGADIWNLLSEPIPVDDLINKLINLYNISKEECTTEVNAFLAKMIEQKMLKTV